MHSGVIGGLRQVLAGANQRATDIRRFPLRGCEFLGNPQRERGTSLSPQVTNSPESTRVLSLTLRVSITNSLFARKNHILYDGVERHR
jgi:hypothetical protein